MPFLSNKYLNLIPFEIKIIILSIEPYMTNPLPFVSLPIITKAEYIKKNPQNTIIRNKSSQKHVYKSIKPNEKQTVSHRESFKLKELNVWNRSESVIVGEGKNESKPSTIIEDTLLMEFADILADQKLNINQVQTSSDKRNAVVNWLALIHTKYWFQQQTLHLSVNIIDRFLKATSDQNIDFELLALTSFWIASKVEERKIKELKVWVKLGRGFHREEVVEMEARVLECLGYDVTVETSQRVLWEMIENFTFLDEKQKHFCLYLLQLTLLCSDYQTFNSHILALSSIYVCLKIFGIEDQNGINEIFLKNWSEIRQCARKMCKMVQKEKGNMKSPIVRKYASKKLSRVSLMEFGRRSDSKMNTTMTTIGNYEAGKQYA